MAPTETTPPAPPPAAHPSATFAEAASRRHWIEHVPRTTAVLAVLAAVSSGQYANQFSRSILAQAEASNQWSYYQAKSIKRHLVESQMDLVRTMAAGNPALTDKVVQLEKQNLESLKKYDAQLAEAKAKAESIVADKDKHQKQGDRFTYAFVVLQAGVILSTIAASAKRKGLWVLAVVCGVAGLLMVANGYLLLDARLFGSTPAQVSAAGK